MNDYKILWSPPKRRKNLIVVNIDNAYELLEQHLNELVRSMGTVLPSRDVSEIRRFTAVGEYGLAFEHLRDVVLEEQLPISATVYEALEVTGV